MLAQDFHGQLSWKSMDIAFGYIASVQLQIRILLHRREEVMMTLGRLDSSPQAKLPQDQPSNGIKFITRSPGKTEGHVADPTEDHIYIEDLAVHFGYRPILPYLFQLMKEQMVRQGITNSKKRKREAAVGCGVEPQQMHGVDLREIKVSAGPSPESQ